MDLNESKLGKREYWADFYEAEIRNFRDNPNDTGEVWFSDSSAEDMVIDFLEENIVSPVSVLDLGTGNGRFLFSLRDAGVQGPFLGIDYVESSVKLSTEIAASEGYSDICFKQADLLNDTDLGDYDVVHDKGTLDAIALSGEPNVAQKYATKVRPLVKSRFVITSCNFTEEELHKIFDSCFDGWQVESLPYPTFTFGGAQGSTVTTIVYTNTKAPQF